jgi:hypothetical protein
MTADDIRPLLTADPFVRFYLSLSDGSGYEVTDPAQVSFPSGGVLEVDVKGRRSLIALAHVVSIAFPPAAGGDPFFLRGRP